jgi:hypothetical protein
MNDVKVGMRLRSIASDYRDIVVTELTSRGFKYKYDAPFLISPGIGVTDGGEHFGLDGDSLYELVPEGEICEDSASPRL